MVLGKVRQEEQAPTSFISNEPLGDLRFRNLLSAQEWASLPQAVRRRFSKRVAAGETVVYAGKIACTRLTGIGWLIGQVARLCGGPLPVAAFDDVPAVVTITEDMVTDGQVWTRVYARRDGFPQVIHSSKRFGGPTGLEEHVGRGVGMELSVHVEDGQLAFRSVRYFVRFRGWTLFLPIWLSPGALTVTHAEKGDGHFTFTLDVTHPWFGPVIHQSACFREVLI